ncbi:MFS transporter [Streptomyces sp. ISL-94]|uniref:MFS transporter n=1 Tax=Streptomyces sp. ISL-94 TaxID=2819190 RepID=UPI001BEC30B1|nr:MFS transporter [Streptomyces sp. ISL-94]MBT2480430.1 MFS transporter [Streptomyces sp. ISL-94]
MRRTLALTTAYLLTHLGYFSLLPVLPLLLERGAGAAGAGAALLCFTVSARAASVLISGWLERFPARRGMVGGLLLAAGAFMALAFRPPFPVLLVLLLAAGCGISVNGLTVRAYVSQAVPDSGARHKLFTAVSLAVNVAAALGPVVGTLLVWAGRDERLWLLVGGCYLLAAATTRLMMPAVPAARGEAGTLRRRLSVVRGILRSPYARRLAAVNVLGWFVYAQLFSALPLFLADTVDSRAVAAYFTANAIAVILLQAPVSALVTRRMAAGTSPLTLLRHGCLLLALAFPLMAVAAGLPWLIFAGIVVFSLGEALYVPLVDTAFADLAADSAYESFNARQVVTAAGESLGSFAGSAGYLVLGAQFGHGAWFLIVGATALAVLGVLAVWGTALPESSAPVPKVAS